MKEIIGVETKRTWVSGVRRAAAVGCLMVLGGWTGAIAQFTSTSNGYTVTHTASSGLTQWQEDGPRTGWTVQNLNQREGVYPKDQTTGNGFLTLKNSIHECSPNGDYTVTFGMARDNERWNLGSAAIVFRYTSASAFYAVRVHWTGDNNNTHKVILAKNVLNGQDITTDEILVGTFTEGAGTQIKLTIKLRGDTVTVYKNDKAEGTPLNSTPIIVTGNPNGQVGYAQGNQYQYGAVFYSSSWTSASPPALGGNYLTWDTSPTSGFQPGSGNWTTDNYWTTNGTALTAWAAGRSAHFRGSDGTYAVTLSAAASVDTIRFDASGYTVSGTGTLTVVGGGRVIADAGKTATIDAALAGAAGLRKQGAGTLILGGRNNYTGGTTVDDGVLVASRDTSLGAASGAVSVAAGKVLEFRNARIPNAITLANGSKLRVAGSGPSFIYGSVTLTGTDTVQANAQLVIDGVASGTGNLVKIGTTKLTVNGDNTHSATRTIYVKNDTLQVGSGAAGSLFGSVDVAAGAAVAFNRTGEVTQNGISGAGGLVNNGTGTLKLSGTNNSHSGTVTINAGAIEVAAEASIGPATVTTASGGRLRLNTTGTANLTKTITGGGALEKTGTGTLNLTGTTAMTFGQLYVSGGTLNQDRALTVDSIAVSSGATLAVADKTGKDGKNLVVNSGTLNLTDGAAADTIRSNVILNGAGKIEHLGSAQIPIKGSLTMSAASTIELSLSASKTTAPTISVGGAAAFTGTLNLKKTGGAALTDSDIGTYQIVKVTGAVNGTFTKVTVDGDEHPNGYSINLLTVGTDKIVKVSIEKTVDSEVTNNNLRVTGVTFVEANASGSVVDVAISGFDGLRSNLTGNPHVEGAYVWYKQGTGAALNDTVGGGRIAIPLSPFPTGNTQTVKITIPAAKVVDTLYYFSASVDWNVSNSITRKDPNPSGSSAPSTYLSDSKKSVLANGLGITVNVRENTAAHVIFDLTVTGQNAAELTPAPYKPSVDSVAVWFKRNGEAPRFLNNGNTISKSTVGGADKIADTVLVFSLSRLRADGTFSFQASPVITEADIAHFAVAPRWKGAAFDSLARPLKLATPQSIPNPNRELPNNPVVLTHTQNDTRAPKITVTVGVSPGEEFNNIARDVGVNLSLDQTMTPIINAGNNTFTKAEIIAGTTFEVTDNNFVGEERLVYYKITVSDDAGIGVERSGSFTVGRVKPIAPTGITFTPLGGGNAQLTWNRVDTAANKIGNIGTGRIYVYYGNGGQHSTDGSPQNTVSASTTEVILSGLEPETEYWFAVVLEDIIPNAPQPSWNLKSDPAVIRENSGPAHVALNIVKIDTVRFVESNSSFSVAYSLIEGKNGQQLNYDVTFDQAGTVVVKSERNLEMTGVSGIGDQSILSISLGSDLMFDTTYWIHLYTTENGVPGAGKSAKTVKVGPFTHQNIWVVPGNSKSANNNNFKFDAGRWSSVSDSLEIKIESSQTPPENDIRNAGFIPVGDYGYTYSMVRTEDLYLPLVAPKISIRADVPDGYSTDKVMLYRWNGNYWEVAFDTKYEGGYFTGTAIDSVYKDVNKTYRLMINTVKPTVSNIPGQNGQDVVDMDGQINRASFTVSTLMGNVGNFRVNLLTGPAKDSTVLDSARISYDIEKGITRNFTFSIGPEVVENSVNFGVLAFIIVNNGSGDTAINISYRVKSNRYGGFTAPAPLKDNKKWFPFAAQVELVNDSIKTPLEKTLYKGEDRIGVHDTLYRLFRYNKTEADRVGNASGWIEYSPNNNDGLFAMKPARLMWFKTSVPGAIFDFGAATSISLRDVFEITLPPNQWTDLVLPFRFDVCLGDVKDAMADEWSNLEFYRWEGGNPKFLAKVLNSPTADYDSVQLKGNAEPFTVFNKNTSRSVTLRIPPIPARLSSHYKAVNGRRAGTLAKTTAGAQYGTGGTWHYTLHTTADGYEVSDVFVGYYATEWAFAVPPSFGDESVVLVGDDGAEMGHHFGPSIAGGRTYKLRFYNDGRQRTAFKFSATPSANIPFGARVTFVRASTGEILGGGSNSNSEYGITVAGMSHEDVFMIVGNSGYRAKAASVNAGAKFTVGRINVNMSARSALISYYIPESGINQVEVSIYDIKGRQVWRTSQTAKAAAWNTVEWRSRGSRWGTASTGLYIVRIKAMGAGGRPVGAATKRIMFSR
ncbi:MAG: autotransporter-associated beta strand repeat-containing protein [Chitinispirillales bacterium]|nr:autotransporter-associated beta strand repeat-containing protein [Chitinispirillales bacterium]